MENKNSSVTIYLMSTTSFYRKSINASMQNLEIHCYQRIDIQKKILEVFEISFHVFDAPI